MCLRRLDIRTAIVGVLQVMPRSHADTAQPSSASDDAQPSERSRDIALACLPGIGFEMTLDTADI
jgi:hypothetical protein